jgi:chromosome segregation ATPase
MNFTNPLVGEIENKVNEIANQRNQYKNQVVNLNDEIASLSNQLKSKESEIAELEQKYKIMKLAKSLEGGEQESNKDLKLKINEMVREIDKCIALLNK